MGDLHNPNNTQDCYTAKTQYNNRLDLRIPKEQETENRIEEAGLDLMEYSRSGRTRIKLTKKEIKEQHEFLTELIKMAYEKSVS